MCAPPPSITWAFPTPTPVAKETMYRATPRLQLRAYQQEAVDAFFAPHHQDDDSGTASTEHTASAPLGSGGHAASVPLGSGGHAASAPRSGILIMPCGAGKTITAIAILARAGVPAVWITVETTAAQQCASALRACTTARVCVLGTEPVGVRTQVVVGTYAGLAPRTRVSAKARHDRDMILRMRPRVIVFDETHRFPATTFRRIRHMFPESARRIGLTATLVRMDGRESFVRRYIGPVVVRQDWQQLVIDGHLPRIKFVDVVVAGLQLTTAQKNTPPAIVEIAANIARGLVAAGRHVVVYSDELRAIRTLCRANHWPCIEGGTPDATRLSLVRWFNECACAGRGACIVCSKVGDAAIDLFADAAIEITRKGGLEQRAQRAGRCMRSQYTSPDGARSALYVSIVDGASADMLKIQRQAAVLSDDHQDTEIVVLDGRRPPTPPAPRTPAPRTPPVQSGWLPQTVTDEADAAIEDMLAEFS